MNGNKRQKMLFGLLGAVAVIMGGEWLYTNYYEAPLEEAQARTDDLRAKINKREQELLKARKVEKKFAAWNAQSLPSDAELARSLYLAWLVDRVRAAGIESPNVDSGSAVSRRGLYQALSFSVRGQGTLEQLTRFLFDFYKAGHLHQIQSLGITPLRDKGRLDLSLSIETLILPDADRDDRLADKPSPRFAARSLADYRVIPERNLFGVGGSGPLDPAGQTWLSGVTARDDQLEAWFDLRATSSTVRLRKGESLDVGNFRGRIVDIADGDVVIETEGERWLLSVGENLDQAFAVPPEF
jgi:Tfp pilus assembly protein PilO